MVRRPFGQFNVSYSCWFLTHHSRVEWLNSISFEIFLSVCLSDCPFDCLPVRAQTWIHLFVAVCKVKLRYLVCTFLRSNTFSWYQQWPPCNLDDPVTSDGEQCFFFLPPPFFLNFVCLLFTLSNPQQTRSFRNTKILNTRRNVQFWVCKSSFPCR